MKTDHAAGPGKPHESRHPKPRKMGLHGFLLALVAVVLLPFSAVRAQTVYAVADNGSSNLFGSLDLATGQFTTIAKTMPLFYAITTGPGGTLYGSDLTTGHLFTISPEGATTQFGSVTAPAEFNGLAYSASGNDFLADNVGAQSVVLFSITGDGNSISSVGTLAGPNAGSFPTGNLAFGPGGTLYFNYSADQVNATASQLYTIDPATGALTAVGTGLGTEILVLLSDGQTLYGIDTFTTDNIGIYTIDTSSGVATRVSTVTGLPSGGGYYLDAATVTASGPTVAVSSTATTLVKGGPKQKIVFTRSGDTTADLTIDFKLTGSAVNGTDYGTGDGQPLGTSITIPAGATKAKLKVVAFADSPNEGGETLKLKLTATPNGAYVVGSPRNVKLSITDTP